MSKRIAIKKNYMFYIVSWLFWGGMCGILISILFYSQLQPYYEVSLHKVFQMVKQISKGNGIYIQSCFIYQIKKWMLLILFSGVTYFLVMYFCYFFFKGMMRGLLLGTLLQKCGIKGIIFWGMLFFPQGICYLTVELATAFFLISRRHLVWKMDKKQCGRIKNIVFCSVIVMGCLLLGAYMEGYVNISIIKWIIKKNNL